MKSNGAKGGLEAFRKELGVGQRRAVIRTRRLQPLLDDRPVWGDGVEDIDVEGVEVAADDSEPVSDGVDRRAVCPM